MTIQERMAVLETIMVMDDDHNTLLQGMTIDDGQLEIWCNHLAIAVQDFSWGVMTIMEI